jgi:predicted nucleic acid-binding protein
MIVIDSSATATMRRIHTAPIDVVSMHNLTELIWWLSGTFSTYDACYVALAQHRDTALITCDPKLAKDATKHIPVVTPE